MNARKPTARLLLLGATATLALAPYAADSTGCPDDAARNLLAASYVSTALNASALEDLEFLYSEGGFPNIMVVIDTSGSMNRLPPDGPSNLGGTLPPGYFLSNPGSSASQTTAFNSASRVVGCGIDPVSAGNAAFTSSGMYKAASARRFNTPCGTAVNPALIGAAYGGQAVDYADQMKVCPYFTSSNNQAVGAPGFDPDYYDAANPLATASGSKDIFFGKNLVFHDNSYLSGAYASNTYAFKHNFGDGWNYDWLAPARAGGSNATIAAYCATQAKNPAGTVMMQGGLSHESICNTCLTQKGWYYDGVILEDSWGDRYPSIWYSGNYLSFFPPKFLIARKVLKDIIAVQSRIRMAMANFDGSGAKVFQPFNPTCGMPDNSNFDSNRAAYVSSIDQLEFSGGTPMALALFDAGRYYHSPDLPWFGATWESSTKESASNANQSAVCFSCQTSTVILITDGQPNANDGSTLPPLGTTQAQADGDVYAGAPSTGIKGIVGTTPCKECGSFSGTDDYLNNLPRVAWYLKNMDLRKNTETTLDCKGMGGKQGVTTYTLGFATGQLPSANTILRNAASAGGGIFVGAEDPSALKQGINYILQEISTRATSFSVATISTLQTTTGRSVIVPRFSPSKSAHWAGNLFRFDLYSEFVNDCEPNGVGDLDCDGRCESAFLQDKAKPYNLISEDGNGAFVKNEPSGAPLCAQAPACAAAGKSCAVPGSASAADFWDAGRELAKKAWSRRYVFTVVDSNGDGRIDRSDPVLRLTDSDAAADKVVPYLGLGTNGSGVSVCTELASRLATAGDSAAAARVVPPAVVPTATQIADAKRECAKTLVRYVLGADILNEQGLKSPDWPKADPSLLEDRAFKLGDIYHSSPVEVMPPLPREGVLCPNGLHNQCIPSLWATPTPMGKEGYDEYSKNARYVNRDKVVLVGANDGLLHAFQGGTWRAGSDDPYTDAVNEALPPFNGYFDRGTADELWAFAPPDMLSKLPLLLGGRHQFYVDGTPMVRDVWVDGTGNGLGSGSKNGAKEGAEFHTVAVVGERRGGTRYFALDVTDAFEAGKAPDFLWVYPQPNDPESLTFGETYDDFLPTPPPIGPVRIDAATSANANTQEREFPGKVGPVKYHERWVAFLNGGFDPQYVRGRGVHMVDVWTGEELFDFSYDPAAAAGDPRLNLRYPIPAVVGMMGWGSKAYYDSYPDHDYFFDTATFGDAGGQLWTLRFMTPGELGSDGKVKNWYGARAFQMGGQASCALCCNQPIFNITTNSAVGAPRKYRVAFGTGDRYNLLDKNGGTCGPDNVRACVMRGCTVTVDPNFNYLAAYETGIAKRGLSHPACSAAMSNSQSDGTITTCTADGSARIVISGCPGSLTTTKDVSMTCTDQADGYRCETLTNTAGNRIDLDPAKYPIDVGNWFLSLKIFDDTGARDIFKTLTEAKAYDAARLWVKRGCGSAASASPGITVRAATDESFGAGAAEEDPGWAIYYNHGPTATIDYHQYTVAWQDERTTTQAAIGAGNVMTWHSIQPSIGEVASTSGSCRASKCTAQNRRVSYHYCADLVSGRLCAGETERAKLSYLLVPNQADQRTVFVNQEGQVAIGLTAVNPEKGASNVGMSEPEDPTSDAGYLEIGKELHDCRHVDGVTTQPTCK